uniref:Uncharacterized protein n=1 Tax=Rhizophora mucronata TaxID=61149 RepID=A0A2P2Q2V7_RHIMU
MNLHYWAKRSYLGLNFGEFSLTNVNYNACHM